MFKKSIQIVLIQLSGSVLGLLTIYFIAGDMAPEVYSLIGVYTVISGVVLTFSQLGIETVMTREALSWMEQKNDEKVKEYATQAILTRVLMFLILLPFLGGYLFYLNIVKYDSEYTLLMCLFLIGAFFSAINNAMSLIVRAKGEYVFSQVVSTANTYLIKFVGLALYFMFDANVYLYFYALSSIPVAIIYGFKLRSSFTLKYISIFSTIKKIWSAKYLWLKSYLDYLSSNADSLLVSVMFPASIMGSYTIFKNLETMLRVAIDGFFDVLSQHTIRYKGMKDKLLIQEKKIKKARTIIAFLFIIGIFVYMVDMNFWIQLVKLEHYAYIDILILFIAILGLIYVLGKYEINAIAFFAPSKTIFNVAILMVVISIMSYFWLFALSNVYGMLAQKSTFYILNSIIMIIIFQSKKETYYSEVAQ